MTFRADDGAEIEMNEALLKTHSRLTMREVNHYIAKPMSGQEYNCADALYKGTPNTSQALQILQTVGGLGTMSPGLTFSPDFPNGFLVSTYPHKQIVAD